MCRTRWRSTLRTLVNGKVTQAGNTRDMIFDVPFLIEYFSQLHDAARPAT